MVKVLTIELIPGEEEGGVREDVGEEVVGKR